MTRTYTAEQIDSRVEELEEIILACDETIDRIDEIIHFPFCVGGARQARDAMLRVRADAQQAISFWVSRRPVP